MRRKGFTLVELLVVIAIIALLMGILMPALAKVRQTAYQMVCGTNLSGISKAMLLYAQDYEDEFPRAGTLWTSPIPSWLATNRTQAYGSDARASVTSNFYLLVKYNEVPLKQFVCKSEGSTVWDPQSDGVGEREITTLWDFGTDPLSHCSYTYHYPYGQYWLRTSAEPALAMIADRNPWIAADAANAKDFTLFDPLGNRDAVRAGNSAAHQNEGQNVGFVDTHVEFCKSPDVGLNNDNIYTPWASSTGADLRVGIMPVAYSSAPQSRSDSFLVNDGAAGSGGGGKGRSCFAADTPVWVDGELVPISQAAIIGKKVGKLDSVSSAVGLIEGIEEHPEGLNDCYEMELESGDTLIIVHSHYFLTVSDKWVAVEDLTSGTKLQSLNGPISVKSVIKRAMPFTGKCYNLILKDSEQYFVGKDGVVALDCSKKTWELLRLASQ